MNKFNILNKKFFCFLIVFLLIFSAIGIHFSYAKDNTLTSEDTLLTLSNTTFYPGDVFNLTINFSTLEIQDFKLELNSSSTLENASIVIEEGINTSLNSGTLIIEGNTTLLPTNKLIVSFTIPSDTTVGTKIDIDALISSTDEKISSEFISLIVSEKETIHTNDTIPGNNQEPSKNTSIDTNEDQNRNSGITNINPTMNNESTKTVTSSISTMNFNASSSVKEETITYKGSDNNYLSSLAVSGYSLNTNFTKTNTSYFLAVPSDITSLDISAIAESSLSSVCIYGNDSLTSGTNKILITVTSESGSTKTYRIFIEKN